VPNPIEGDNSLVKSASTKLSTASLSYGNLPGDDDNEIKHKNDDEKNDNNSEDEEEKSLQYLYSPAMKSLVDSTIPKEIQQPYFSLYYTRNSRYVQLLL
jgi:hypothetical protein